MTDTLFALVPTYGPYLILACVFLSCLAVPLPSSLLVLASGGFAASGDLEVWAVGLAAFSGFTAGDQMAYQLGRKGGDAVKARLSGKSKVAALMARAESFVDKRGAWAVFLSRTVVSPLAAYVSYVGAAGGLGWARFTLPAVLGAAVWCSVYVGLGYSFTDQMTEIADLLSNLAGIIIALAVMVGAGAWMRKVLREARVKAKAEAV
jgi:membrane-associated protein